MDLVKVNKKKKHYIIIGITVSDSEQSGFSPMLLGIAIGSSGVILFVIIILIICCRQRIKLVRRFQRLQKLNSERGKIGPLNFYTTMWYKEFRLQNIFSPLFDFQIIS